MKENEVEIVVPEGERQAPEIDKKNDKNDEKWDFESPRNLQIRKLQDGLRNKMSSWGSKKKENFGKIGK